MKYKDKYTIIIKFTQNDNICASDQKFGWVDYFAKLLQSSITYQIPSEVEFVYKTETEVIGEKDFNQSDLIIYILSPAFILSSNINQDAAELETAFNFDIPFINNKVKKVFKAPVKVEELPLSISTPTYYRFFNYNEEGSEEYATFEGWNTYQENMEYWRVFSDVLNDALISFSPAELNTLKNVYISNKSEHYFDIRNNLKRELNAYNVKIFPDEDFSIEANYMEDPESFFMERCDLSIHFPEEFIALSKEERDQGFSKLPEHKRFLWFNPIESLEPEKIAKYNELKVQLKPYKNIEAIETSIEELKDIIKTQIFADTNNQNNLDRSKEIVYVISDTLFTAEESARLENNPEIQSKYNLKILSNVENVADYRLMHYQLLKYADHFIIMHLKSNKEWLKTMVSEVKKAPGFNRENIIKSKHIALPTDQFDNTNKITGFNLININSKSEFEKSLIEILP